MRDLIADSYSEDEVDRFSNFKLSEKHTEEIVQHGKNILFNIRPIPYFCAYMSALWGAAVRDNTEIPIHVVAGNLIIDNKKVFYSDERETIKQAFASSNPSWDGHVWVNFAGQIGDISIFRSAYGQSKGHWLRKLITNQFGEGKGLLFGSIPQNMTYEPIYVLTDDEITSLLLSCRKLL